MDPSIRALLLRLLAMPLNGRHVSSPVVTSGTRKFGFIRLEMAEQVACNIDTLTFCVRVSEWGTHFAASFRW